MKNRNILCELRKNKHKTQQELADYLGITQSGYGRLEQVNVNNMATNTLNKLADYYNVSIDYLLGKSGRAERKGFKVAVLGVIPAGIPIEAIEEIIDYEEIDQETAKTGEFFGLKVSGDSMQPDIKHGDIVIVRKQQVCDTGDICVVIVNGDNATLKKIKKEQGGIWLVPLNEKYKPKFYDNEEIKTTPIQIIGKVIEARRKF